MEIGKKIVENDYHTIEEDFVAEGELTVTITLHEYRQLVRAAADAEIKIANHDRYEASVKAKNLEIEWAKLKEELDKKDKHIADLQLMLEGQSDDLPWSTPAYDPDDAEDLPGAAEVEGANE